MAPSHIIASVSLYLQPCVTYNIYLSLSVFRGFVDVLCPDVDRARKVGFTSEERCNGSSQW